MTDVIKTADREGVRVITIDNAPVNAISAAVRTGVQAAIKAAEADPAVKAIVLTGAGRAFIAGADIREFGKPPAQGVPTLRTTSRPSRPARKPWWRRSTAQRRAAVSKWRWAAISRGASQGRAWPSRGQSRDDPRRDGNAAFAARRRRRSRARHDREREPLFRQRKCPPGLADEIAEDVVGKAVALALAKPPRRLSEDDSKLAAQGEAGPVRRIPQGMARRFRGSAPFKCVEAVELCVKYPYAEGIAKENEIFAWCQEQPRRAACATFSFRARSGARAVHQGHEAARDQNRLTLSAAARDGAASR